MTYDFDGETFLKLTEDQLALLTDFTVDEDYEIWDLGLDDGYYYLNVINDAIWDLFGITPGGGGDIIINPSHQGGPL